MLPEIQFETRGAILIVTFNLPDNGNRFNGTMAKILSDKLKAITEDRAIRVLMLRGSGDNFMNGHDIRAYTGEMNVVQDQVFQKVQFFYNAIRELSLMERPVVSVVQGLASGAGLNFVAVSDFVIATRSARFCGGYTDNAMVPDAGITFFLPRKIGQTRATEMLMLNEVVSAEQARQWGLVNYVVDDATLEAEAFALAEKLATGPTRVYGSTKRLLAKSSEQDLNAQLALEAAYWNTGAKSFDFREAMKAFLAQRQPKYTGS